MRMNGPNGSHIVCSLADPVAANGSTFDQTDAIERLLTHRRQFVRSRQALADMDVQRTSLKLQAAPFDVDVTGCIPGRAEDPARKCESLDNTCARAWSLM